MKNPSLGLVAITLLCAGLASCQPGNATPAVNAQGTPQQVPTKEGSPSGAPLASSTATKPSTDAIKALWQGSPHANTYVVDAKNTNSTCAYCHTPLDFIPSMDDIPESCAVCKFTVQPPAPLITKDKWQGVTCAICHQEKKGEVKPEVLWLSIPPILEYEKVASNTELCMKCHTVDKVGGHVGFTPAGVHKDYTCTQCHDAHSTVGSCGTDACHAQMIDPAKTIPGHDQNHENVTCWACHDASMKSIAKNAQGKWTTFLEGTTNRPFMSHNLVKEVPCERCHFANNPWQLKANVK